MNIAPLAIYTVLGLLLSIGLQSLAICGCWADAETRTARQFAIVLVAQ